MAQETAAAASAFSFHRKLDKAGLMETLDQAAEDLGEEGTDIYFGRGFLSLESIKPEEEENKVYRESVVTEKEFGAVITILNHIHYDEKNGMADIDNYRLRMGEESDGK